jgi:tRNA(Glu) U13 pseudouridine synthase TruD
MPRRKYIIHDYTTDRIKESFGRIILHKKQRNQSRRAFGKVSTTFLFFYDRYIEFLFDANNLIMTERRKKEKNKLYIHAYSGYIFNMIASTDIFGSHY